MEYFEHISITYILRFPTISILFIKKTIYLQNEKNQIMKSNVWLRLVWSDYQLQWDEADYGGIGVLRLPPDKVWKPDIVLFNK